MDNNIIQETISYSKDVLQAEMSYQISKKIDAYIKEKVKYKSTGEDMKLKMEKSTVKDSKDISKQDELIKVVSSLLSSCFEITDYSSVVDQLNIIVSHWSVGSSSIIKKYTDKFREEGLLADIIDKGHNITIIDLPNYIDNTLYSEDKINKASLYYGNFAEELIEGYENHLSNISQHQDNPSEETSIDLIREDFRVTDFTFSDELLEKYHLINNIDDCRICSVIQHNELYSLSYYTKDNKDLKTIETKDMCSIRFIQNKSIKYLTTFIYNNFNLLIPDVDNVDMYEILNILFEALNLLELKRFSPNTLEEVLRKACEHNRYRVLEYVIDPLIVNTADGVLLFPKDDSVPSILKYDKLVERFLNSYSDYISESDIEGGRSLDIFSVRYKPTRFNYETITSYNNNIQEQNAVRLYTYSEIKKMVNRLNSTRINTFDFESNRTNTMFTNKSAVVTYYDSTGSTTTHKFNYPKELIIKDNVINLECITKTIANVSQKMKFNMAYRSELLSEIHNNLSAATIINQSILEEYFNDNSEKLARNYITKRVRDMANLCKSVLVPLSINYANSLDKYIYENIFSPEGITRVEVDNSTIDSATLVVPSELISNLLNTLLLSVNLSDRYTVDCPIGTVPIGDTSKVTLEDLYGVDFKSLTDTTVKLSPADDFGREVLKLILLLVDIKFEIKDLTEKKEVNDMLLRGIDGSKINNTSIFTSPDDITELSQDWSFLWADDERLGVKTDEDKFEVAKLYIKYIYQLINYVPLVDEAIINSIPTMDIELFAYTYAQGLLKSNKFELKPIEVLFNNKVYQNEDISRLDYEFIINRLQDILCMKTTYDRTETPYYITKTIEGSGNKCRYVVVGAMRDIYCLSNACFKPGLLKKFNLKFAKITVEGYLDKCMQELISLSKVDGITHSIRQIMLNKKKDTNEGKNTVAELNKFINNEIIDKFKVFGKFTHTIDCKLAFDFAIANTVNSIKNAKEDLFSNVFILSDEVVELLRKFEIVNFEYNLLKSLSYYTKDNEEIKGLMKTLLGNIVTLKVQLMQHSNKVYDNINIEDIGTGDRDFKKLLLEGKNIDNYNLSNVSLEALLDEEGYYSPFIPLRVISEMYDFYVTEESSFATDSFIETLFGYTDTRASKYESCFLDLNSRLDYGIFASLLYLVNTKRFNNIFNQIETSDEIIKVCENFFEGLDENGRPFIDEIKLADDMIDEEGNILISNELIVKDENDSPIIVEDSTSKLIKVYRYGESELKAFKKYCTDLMSIVDDTNSLDLILPISDMVQGTIKEANDDIGSGIDYEIPPMLTNPYYDSSLSLRMYTQSKKLDEILQIDIYR